MERNDLTRFVLPVIIAVIVILALVILGGLASGNPDGYEWAFFEFLGASEPEGGFEGIFSFLGETPLMEVLAGAIGVVFVLVLAFAIFRAFSRKNQ